MKPSGLVLASGSPQRRKLLASMGLKFKVVPSGVPEPAKGNDWRKLVRGLALRKARSVARRHPRSLVVGADTVVVCRGKLLLKPRGRRHSMEMLQSLSGRWHRVYTGVALVWKEGRVETSGAEVTRCHARRLSDAELEKLAGKHMDKSGSYAVQDRDDPFIDRLDGPKDNVIGFPRALLKKLAKSAGVALALAVAPGARASEAGRISALTPAIVQVGLEIRGGGRSLGWPGEPDMAPAKVSAALDELGYLSNLASGAARTGTSRFLTDTERHRIGTRFFEPVLTPLGLVGIEDADGVVWLKSSQAVLARGALDLYLRRVEACVAAGKPVPAPRSLALSLGDDRRWLPARLDAKKGEWVVLTLSNASASGGAGGGFKLEALVEFREVPALGATTVSFPAEREGSFAYYDPAFRDRGEGALAVAP